MSGPVRVQLSRAKGWRMPPNTVKVDRSTKWGNPFVRPEDPAFAVLQFGFWLKRLEAFPAIKEPPLLDHLRGKNLACWCKLGEPCHADVLLELANTPTTQERQDDD